MFDNAAIASFGSENNGIGGSAIASPNLSSLDPLSPQPSSDIAQSLPTMALSSVAAAPQSIEALVESDVRSGERIALGSATISTVDSADSDSGLDSLLMDSLLMGGLVNSEQADSEKGAFQPASLESDAVVQSDLAALSDFGSSAGTFVVGDSGQVEIDFLFDGGGYAGELAIFNLAGMNNLSQSDFVQEAARRAASNSAEGQIVVSDITEGAQFTGELGESDMNAGQAAATKTLQLSAGAQFAIMLVPNGTIEEVINGAQVPLFSIAEFNPNGDNQLGKADEGVFAFEDLILQNSDRDFNDLIFRITGATDSIIDLEELVAPNRSWINNPIAQAFLTAPTFSEKVPDASQNPVDSSVDSSIDSPTESPDAPSNQMPPVENLSPEESSEQPSEQPTENSPSQPPAEKTPPGNQSEEQPVAEEQPTEEAPVEESLEKETPTEEPVEEQPPAEDASENETPTEDSSEEQTPDEESPEAVLPVASPTEERSEEESAEPPAEETSEEETSEEETSEEAAPNTPPADPFVSAISTEVAKFNGNSTEAEIIASGAQKITIGTQTIYIGTEQVTSNNQDPIIRSFDPVNPSNNWTRRDLETSGTDGRGLGLFWTGSALYGVFSVDGTQTDGQDFRRATDDAKQDWLKSFGSGQGKIAVLGQIDPNTGELIAAAHLSAVKSDGSTNSLFVTGASVNESGNILVEAQSYFSPRQPDGSAKTKNPGNNEGSPFDYTIEITSDLSEVISTSAPGWT